MRRLGLYFSLIVIYLSGALVLLDFFTRGLVNNAGALLSLWVSFIMGFALLLGLLNILRVHLGRVARRGPEAFYSLALLLSAFLVIGAGVYGRAGGLDDAITNWIFQYLYQPLSAAFFSLLAFLMFTTALRFLTLRTVEAALLLVGAFIVLAGQVAISPLNDLAAITRWFQDYPVQGAIRGILIGAALGAIATSLRYLLGVDNQYLH